MTFRRRFYYLFLATIVSVTPGCSFFESEFEPFSSPILVETQPQLPDEQKLSQVPVEAAPGKKPAGDDSVVIKWLVPEAELDGYIIRYGFSATSLEYEERLNWKSIPTLDDESRGKIFVHNLVGLPTDKTIFVSLAGIKDDKVSKPTPIFSVNPTKAAE